MQQSDESNRFLYDCIFHHLLMGIQKQIYYNCWRNYLDPRLFDEINFEHLIIGTTNWNDVFDTPIIDITVFTFFNFDAKLCRDRIRDNGKIFITKLVQNRKNVSCDLKNKFGRRHSESKIKNVKQKYSRKAEKQKQEGTRIKKRRTKKAREQQQEVNFVPLNHRNDSHTRIPVSSLLNDEEQNNIVLHLPSSDGSYPLLNNRNDSFTRIAVSSLLNDEEQRTKFGEQIQEESNIDLHSFYGSSESHTNIPIIVTCH